MSFVETYDDKHNMILLNTEDISQVIPAADGAEKGSWVYFISDPDNPVAIGQTVPEFSDTLRQRSFEP